jgi:hypothetical protein
MNQATNFDMEELNSPFGQALLTEAGMQGFNEEVLAQLGSDCRDESVRRAWQEWCPKFVAIGERPAWLFAVNHSDTGCPAPAVPFGSWIFTMALAISPFGGWVRPMPVLPVVPPLCPSCWVELRLNEDRFLIWPDGVIHHPLGRKLVEETAGE